jgi:hypothetical protein
MSEFDNFWYEVEQSAPSLMTTEQQWHIAELLDSIHLDDDTLRGIRIMLSQTPTEAEAHQLIVWLHEVRPNQVTHGNRLPSQTETSKHVKNISGL